MSEGAWTPSDEELMDSGVAGLVSRLSKWRRSSVSNDAQFHWKIDYVVGDSHKDSCPFQTGPAAVLRMFGVTQEGNTVCCHVHGFEPYFYISCLDGIRPNHVPKFRSTLDRSIWHFWWGPGRMRESNIRTRTQVYITKIEIVKKRSLMYYQVQKKFRSFLKIYLAPPTMVAGHRGTLKRSNIEGLGFRSFLTYESNVLFDVVGGNWIELPARSYRESKKQMSYCQPNVDNRDSIVSEVLSKIRFQKRGMQELIELANYKAEPGNLSDSESDFDEEGRLIEGA